MSSSKRPSTSSLRRFITSRPYVPVAEIRRRFGIDDPDCMCCVERGEETVFVGLPEREALKLQELWIRDEIGLEMSVEVRARVVVGIYPMRIARYFKEGNGNGHHPNVHHSVGFGPALDAHPNGMSNGYRPPEGVPAGESQAPVTRPMPGPTTHGR
jgi:hypothetical protein